MVNVVEVVGCSPERILGLSRRHNLFQERKSQEYLRFNKRYAIVSMIRLQAIMMMP